MILSTARAYKRCTENGTWWQVENTLQEWTDYTACVRIEDFRTVHYVAVTCNVGCKVLYVLTRCTWVPVIVYVIIRAVRKDSGCWVRNIKGFEWILYIPNLLCIFVNLVFLLSILRILLMQLQSHPNEPSNYRRALKATAVLVPLFGLHLFLIIYSPPITSQAANIYEIFAAFIKNSQGAIVAIIFCFMNKEVLSHLKESKRRYHGCLAGKDNDMKGLSTNTYVMTERQGQGRYGTEGGTQDSKRGKSVLLTAKLNGSGPSGNGSTVSSFV
ncbi:hypothetical protein C0Q70_09914 [Pomacea canaliculata]|uniref:G-protein coupled receptors family 2 profile 2 domain-containing protein n=1 Tax=Pomacea canaliculata TaxID=400727 RepID=A0A2T7PB54_POMCA|nr:hypothetical protein C0Q70_09914 [Pomacea canaliculata]